MQTTDTTFSSSSTPAAGSQELGENPKDRIGITKPPLHLVPPTSLIHQAEAMRNGADKYGPYNWRAKKVKATVYISAALRHINQFLDGEEIADDSGVSHLGHALACLGIILDAQETGNLVDDRPIPGVATKVIKRLTKNPEPKGFAPIPFSMKPGESVIIGNIEIVSLLDHEELAAVEAEGEADAESRPDYVADPSVFEDATIAAARMGKDEAINTYCRQYGTVSDLLASDRAPRRG